MAFDDTDGARPLTASPPQPTRGAADADVRPSPSRQRQLCLVVDDSLRHRHVLALLRGLATNLRFTVHPSIIRRVVSRPGRWLVVDLADPLIETFLLVWRVRDASAEHEQPTTVVIALKPGSLADVDIIPNTAQRWHEFAAVDEATAFVNCYPRRCTLLRVQVVAGRHRVSTLANAGASGPHC